MINFFKEQVEIDKNAGTIKILVSCERRTHIGIQKKIYTKEISELIPAKYKSRVMLQESPRKRVANINSEEFTNLGVWVYKIVKNQNKQSSTPPATQRTRRKKTTK